MLSARSLILLSVFLFVLSILFGWLSLFKTPDSGGMGRDTYGVKANGYRAVFDLLRELDVPVERQLRPPKPGSPKASVVLIQPDPRIVGTEPAYLHSLLPWVENGGRLVVALTPPESFTLAEIQRKMSEVELPSVLEVLGLSSVELETFSATPGNTRKRFVPRRLNDDSIIDDLKKVFGPELLPPREVSVHREGTLANVAVDRVALAGGVQSLKLNGITPTGTITYASEKNEDNGDQAENILVAEFSRGQGSIVVVADCAAFHNRLIARADNSVLAAQLCAPSGNAVIFDEFYHGLGVRGNPLYLLTRPGYAAFLLGLLLLACLSVWREAILLGPSLPDEVVQRRDIGEYLTAMGRFYSNGRKSWPFLIRQIRAGVLRELSRKFGLPLETQDAQLIAGVISRRDPAWGKRFTNTITVIDTELDSKARWTEPDTINAMRRLTACLSTKT